jgi:basic amino acid/polyamine antiporter, APA family
MNSTETDKGLKKELGLFEVFAIASGAMISSGLFILPAIAYQETGASVIVSYLIATLLMIPTLLSASELTTAMPKAGGNYFFIDRSLGPALGTIGGVSSWFALSAKTAFALIGIGAFVQLFNPGLSDFNLKMIAIIFCIIFTVINLVGVKHAGKTQVYLVVGLLSILVFYVIVGFFYIEPSRFQPFAPHGYGSIFATAGAIFVAFMGLIQVCSVSEEIEKPKRNIPLGMLLAWSIVSALYILVVTVTVGLLDHTVLTSTLMPISKGAEVFAGEIGLIILGVAAILAFITTANAGILSSSRYPLALSKDQLLPGFFSKLSKKGTPFISILFTSGFMISIILFLDLEGLVKVASTLVLLMYVLTNLSVISMRESKIRNYRPSFSSPFYPLVQIIGIVGYIVLIFGMGIFSIAIVGVFILCGFLWYWFFARDKIWREYSLLHIVERLTGEKKTSYLLEEELREILIERDNIQEKRFEDLIKNCEILDLHKLLTPDKLSMVLSERLHNKLDIDKEKLRELLRSKECDSNCVLQPGMSIISHLIKGKDKLDIVLVRTKKGLIISKDIDPIYSFFIIVASEDQQNFYWHTLMWVAQIAEQEGFQDNWLKAKNEEDLRTVFLNAWKKREKY